MLNAVIYTRVSTEEQTTNFSLEGQEKQCREYVKRNNLNALAVFVEEGASAKTVAGRPKLLDLLKFCQNKKNQVSTVIVYKFDRWARNTQEGLALISLLAKHGINLESVTEPSEENAMGKAMRSMMLVFAELDNNIRSERTIGGMKTALENGHWPWKAPIGYRHTTINSKKAMVLIEGYRPILTMLFSEAETGIYTKKELASRLNKRGFTSLFGKPATEKTVEKILSKKFYYGILEAKGWKLEYRGNHEMVTDEQTWLKAYRAMFRYSITGYNTDGDFPLRRFALCDSCFRPMTGSFSRGNGGRFPYYFCNNKACNEHRRVSRDELNKAFVNYLNQFTLSEIQQKLLRVMLLENIEKQILQNNQAIRQINIRLDEIEAEKRSTAKANDKGLLSDPEAEKIIDDLRNKEVVYKVELSEKNIDKNELEAVVNFATNFLVNVGRFWERLDLPRKRALQTAIFPEKVFYKDGEFRTTRISYSFKLIKSFANPNDPLVEHVGLNPFYRYSRTSGSVSLRG